MTDTSSKSYSPLGTFQFQGRNFSVPAEELFSSNGGTICQSEVVLFVFVSLYHREADFFSLVTIIICCKLPPFTIGLLDTADIYTN